MKRSQYIVVVGCGRLGTLLANQLSRGGHSVVVLDRNPEVFRDLSPDFSGFHVEGDVTHLAVLKEVKLEKADVLIATTHEDNVNLMVAQIALKMFRVPRVLARVFDPKREQVYVQLGIETICPTSVAAHLFLEAVGGVDSQMAGENP